MNSDIWNHQKFGTGLYENRGILRNNQVTCNQVRSFRIGEGLVPTDAAVNLVVGRLGAVYEREADKQESRQRNLHTGLSMLFTSQSIRELLFEQTYEQWNYNNYNDKNNNNSNDNDNELILPPSEFSGPLCIFSLCFSGVFY